MYSCFYWIKTIKKQTLGLFHYSQSREALSGYLVAADWSVWVLDKDWFWFFFVIAASSDVLENVLRKCAWEAQALSYTDCTLQMYLQLFFPQRKQNSICIFTEEDHAVVTL